MTRCQMPCAHIRLFLVFTCYLAGKYCKNPKVPGAQHNVNPARAITWLAGVTIYCTFLNNGLTPPSQFLCDKILLKKISYCKVNAHWTNFELRRPRPRLPYMYSYKWLFLWQTTQARSQKFAMGEAVLGVWGRSPQPPEANGGLGAKPPALENFAFFLQK